SAPWTYRTACRSRLLDQEPPSRYRWLRSASIPAPVKVPRCRVCDSVLGRPSRGAFVSARHIVEFARLKEIAEQLAKATSFPAAELARFREISEQLAKGLSRPVELARFKEIAEQLAKAT